MAKASSKTLKNILILVIILLLPGFLYYLLTVEGKNHYKPLPFFGPKKAAKTGHKFHGKFIQDTIYHKLPDFTFTDERGREITPKTFDYKIFIVSLFYTHCPDLCTKVNANVDSLAKFYSKNKMVYFLSVSVDPQQDGQAEIAKYAARYHDPVKWLFVRGDSTGVDRFVTQGLLLNAAKSPDGQFLLGDDVLLIDAEKRIRGIYHGTSVEDMSRLNDEIKVQIAEELLKIKAPEM